jgi:hypothetical protein
MWNSPHFNPIAPASECNFDFVNAIGCSYEQVTGLPPAISQKIEDIIVSIRSDLFRIIQRWNKLDKVKADGTRKKKRRRSKATTRILLLLLTMKYLLSDDDEIGT